MFSFINQEYLYLHNWMYIVLTKTVPHLFLCIGFQPKYTFALGVQLDVPIEYRGSQQFLAQFNAKISQQHSAVSSQQNFQTDFLATKLYMKLYKADFRKTPVVWFPCFCNKWNSRSISHHCLTTWTNGPQVEFHLIGGTQPNQQDRPSLVGLNVA